MKTIHPLILCSTIAALSSGTVSFAVGYVTPTVPQHAAWVESGTSQAIAKTVRTVTTTNDGGPGSLRQAIASSDPGDSIIFVLPFPATIALSNSLVIDKDLNIDGPGADQLTVMRNSAPSTPSFRVFLVNTGRVSIAGMTIRNGRAVNTTGAESNLGGGIFNLGGSLTVSNCVLTANTVPTEFGGGGFGGGIFSDGPLTVVNSTINANYASYAGGGICTFHSESFVAKGSTVSSNFAGIQGGGLNYQGRQGTIQNCTISGNFTPPDAAGSGLLNICFGNEGSVLTLTACTIARNTGSTNAAFQIAALPGNLGLTNRLLSSLVASNDGPNFFLDGNPVNQSLGHNLDSDGTSGFANGVNGDIVGTRANPIDARLAPLQNNGGPTFTHALLPGSPAIDHGSCTDANGAPLLVDQRGYPRPAGAGCDIGAFEAQALTLICPAPIVTTAQNSTGAVVTYTATATSTCSNVSITFTPPSGSVFPIGVTPVTAQASDACGNTAQCTFTVTVLGARGSKSNVLAELIALRASATDANDKQELDEAIADMRASLGNDHQGRPLWVDENHLNRRSGREVFRYEKDAVRELLEILRNPHSLIPKPTIQDLINRIVRADRLLATVSIQDAADAGANPRKIEQDRKEVAKGDEEAAEGEPTEAIQHYENAWAHAVRLTPSKSLAVSSNGKMQLQFLGLGGQNYVIQASTNLVDWVTVGTCTADADGNVTFTDPDSNKYPVRYYRVVDE